MPRMIQPEDIEDLLAGEKPDAGGGCGGCTSLLVVLIVIIGALWALTGDFNNCLDRDYYRSHHHACR